MTLTTLNSIGGTVRERKESVRISTTPDVVISCDTPAGTQTARRGGTTQVVAPAATVITPRLAWTS